jgi:probable addiction module antidote protein
LRTARPQADWKKDRQGEHERILNLLVKRLTYNCVSRMMRWVGKTLLIGSKAYTPTRFVFSSVVRKPLVRRAAVTPKSRLHADSMVEMLKADPAFANAYLQSALEDSHTQEGREALLIALRHVAQAQGMNEVAAKAGIQLESLYRVLSLKGNPTLSTLLAVLGASGLRFSVALGVPA